MKSNPALTSFVFLSSFQARHSGSTGRVSNRGSQNHLVWDPPLTRVVLSAPGKAVSGGEAN